MKKLLLALLCFLLAGGCSVLGTEGEYHAWQAHTDSRSTGAAESGGAIQDYDSLRNAVRGIISAGMENDTILVTGYSGDLDRDLSRITLEMTKIYPLGVYAVSSIVYKPTTILTHTEIAVSVQYSKTLAEMNGITAVTDMADLERRMVYLFASFNRSKVFAVEDFYDTDEVFLRRMEKCWMQSAEDAVGLSAVTYSFYPENSSTRLIEMNVAYLESGVELKRYSGDIRMRAQEICEAFAGSTDREKLDFVYTYLKDNVVYDLEAMRVVAETNGTQPKTNVYTAYGALVEQRAAQSGLALAAQVLCQQLGLESHIIGGTLEDEPYYWLYVNCDGEMLHFDPTSQVVVQPLPTESEEQPAPEDVERQYLFDLTQGEQRFTWNKKVYSIG